MGLSATVTTFRNKLKKAGTAQQVEPGSTIEAEYVTIRALSANKGTVYIGGSEEEASAEHGHELKAGETLPPQRVISPEKFWINGTETGDGICVTCTGP